jgi:hypothetical protein
MAKIIELNAGGAVEHNAVALERGYNGGVHG